MAVLKYWDITVGDYVPLLAPVSGTLIITGTVPPSAAIGAEGNFYLDATGHVLYGPKTGSTWPVAIAQGAPPTAPQTVTFDFPAPIPTWTGMHGFNQSPVDVTLVDAAGEQFVGTVSFPTLNTVQADFGKPVAGHMLVQK